jgi:hypothetical protein
MVAARKIGAASNFGHERRTNPYVSDIAVGAG